MNYIDSMGKRASVSFTEDEEDLWEWVEERKKEGQYKSRSAVITHCIQIAKQELDDSETFT